ncbi:MAG: hypothetical protein HYZ23_05305 [Chloroflexi bacterium]|nr:hypothetical protein [Chloroflexota bacterium]
MDQSSDYSNLIQDNRLADFTDRVMQGETQQLESGLDDELIGLEKTILRLNQALPPVSLDDVAIKKMQVRLNARMRRETKEVRPPFWKRWFDPRSRLQLAAAGLVIALVALVPALIISEPPPPLPATALAPTRGIAIAVFFLLGILLVFLWKRRKK